jgi:Mg2+/Co2+ transporter CorC
MLDEQTFIIQAQINLEEVNEVLELDLPVTEEYQTLGGFLLYQWQKIPSIGETLSYENLSFTVISATGPRLGQIRVEKHDDSASELLTSDLEQKDKRTLPETIPTEQDIAIELTDIDQLNSDYFS